MGLLSFMLDNDVTAGAITTSDDAKRTFAAESLAYNCKNADFCKLFPELKELHEKKVAGGAAGAALPSPAPKPAAAAPSPR